MDVRHTYKTQLSSLTKAHKFCLHWTYFVRSYDVDLVISSALSLQMLRDGLVSLNVRDLLSQLELSSSSSSSSMINQSFLLLFTKDLNFLLLQWQINAFSRFLQDLNFLIRFFLLNFTMVLKKLWSLQMELPSSFTKRSYPDQRPIQDDTED